MSHQKPARVKLAELQAEGVQVEAVWGDDYHLTVDLDTPEAIREFPHLLKALQERRKAEVIDTWTSRSGVGRHYYLLLDRRTSFQERAALQAFLGSDPLREMLGFFDVNNCAEQDPFVLFRPA
jgi:hypothetical protein